MRGRAILAVFFIVSMATALPGAVRSQASSDTREQHRIVLFGAHWCAPCQAEFRNLPALVAAAAPDRLVLAWTDRPLPATVLPATVDTLSAREAQFLAERFGGEGYGLPFTVMLDREGQECAIWRKPLRPDEIDALRAKCRN